MNGGVMECGCDGSSGEIKEINGGERGYYHSHYDRLYEASSYLLNQEESHRQRGDDEHIIAEALHCRCHLNSLRNAGGTGVWNAIRPRVAG